MLVIAAAGAFVPVQTNRGTTDAQDAAHKAELEELQNTSQEANPMDDGTADEIANLRDKLAASEANTAELEHEVEQLKESVADTEADEATLPALLNEQRASQSQFELYEDAGGSWRWRLRHDNGNMIAHGGQGYASRSGVWDGIKSVKRNAPAAEFEEPDE